MFCLRLNIYKKKVIILTNSDRDVVDNFIFSITSRGMKRKCNTIPFVVSFVAVKQCCIKLFLDQYNIIFIDLFCDVRKLHPRLIVLFDMNKYIYLFKTVIIVFFLFAILFLIFVIVKLKKKNKKMIAVLFK